MLTFEGLAYASYDYPEMVEDMVETACVMVEDFLDQVLGHIDFDYAAVWEDICYKSGPIVSVEFFNNVVVPRYKRIASKLAAAGIDLWYTDCDGDVRPIMPDFWRAASTASSRTRSTAALTRRAAGQIRQGAAHHGRRRQDSAR